LACAITVDQLDSKSSDRRFRRAELTAFCPKSIAAMLVAALLAGATAQAQAQDSPSNRQAAAERYLKLVPVLPLIETTVAALAQKVPVRHRSEWVGQMRALIDKRTIAAAVRDALVQTYTTDEIEAMVDFYSSRHGASILAKAPSYMALIEPALMEALRRSSERVLEARR
jgi:hypothetical protein